MGAPLLVAPQAFAASSPTNAELLKACNWASLCKFHPQSYWGYTGPKHQVGSTAYNRGSNTNQHRIDWSDTTTAGNTVGVSVSATYKFYFVGENQYGDWGGSRFWEANDTSNGATYQLYIG